MLPSELETLMLRRYVVSESETLSYLVLREVCKAWNHTICKKMKDKFIVVLLLQGLKISEGETITQDDYNMIKSLFQNNEKLIDDEQLHAAHLGMSILTKVCAFGDLQFAEFLHLHFPCSMEIPIWFHQSLLLMIPVECSHFELCNWLVVKYEMEGKEAIFGTCATNVSNLFGLEWLDEQSPFIANQKFPRLVEAVFENACWNNNVAVVEWLTQRYPTRITIARFELNRCWILRMLAARRCLDVWNFLHRYFQLNEEDYINTQLHKTGDISLLNL